MKIAPDSEDPFATGGAPGLRHVARPARETGLSALAAEAERAAERIAGGRFYVACVGQFKRGKSTLLNALIGEPVLPAGVVPVTSVVTVLRFGAERSARVRFKNGEQQAIPVESLAAYVSEEQNPENASKMMERNTQATTAADVFDAATLGGARALGRDDLGRIAPGAKADLVLWKAACWRMTPLRDPVKNIVYNAADEDIDRVYVNGRVVVDGGRVLGADEPAILKALQAGGERMWPRMAEHDWAGRGADQLSPPTYPPWE